MKTDTMNQGMFVTVRFGEDKKRLFNANCRNEILLDHIKKKCDCELDDIVELSDEQGVVKNLRNHPLDYGTDYLKERETLILLKVESNSSDDADPQNDRSIYIPLLTSLENDSNFIETINPKMEEYNKERSGSNVDPDDIKNMKKVKSPKQRNKGDNNNNNNNNKKTPSSKVTKR